jgi:2-polyprenyl-3-methyl-5-hydroxy-6-metoxy-1,4-benzoquinol methylase
VENIPSRFQVSKSKVTKELAEEFFEWIPHNKSEADATMALLDEYLTTEKVVLDLGCGIGLESRYFAERGTHVVGVDISPKNIVQAKLNNDKYHRLTSFIVDDITTMTLNRKYNIVLLHNVLEHVFEHEQKQTLENAIRHTCTNGVIFIKCPTEEYKEKFSQSDLIPGQHVNPDCFQILDEVVSLDLIGEVFKRSGVKLLFLGYRGFIEDTPVHFIIIGRKVV